MTFLGMDSLGKVALFLTYIVLWSAQGILVHNANKRHGSIQAASIVLVQEILKMGISISLFIFVEQKNFRDFLAQIKLHRKLAIYYIVPAFLYSVYNNLTFTGLRLFDPASYFVLMQFRIVITAGMSVLLLNKSFSTQQWTALTVIMVGAMFKEIPNLWGSSTDNSDSAILKYSVIVTQLLMSTLAGVFNEKLLKTDASPNIQNLFMYINCVWMNFFFGQFSNNTNSVEWTSIYIWPVILNAACLGVLTGFFLKYLSSVLKSIASAIELWLTAIASAMVFGYPIDFGTVAGIAIVSLGIYMYGTASVPAVKPQRPASADGLELGGRTSASSSGRMIS